MNMKVFIYAHDIFILITFADEADSASIVSEVVSDEVFQLQRTVEKQKRIIKKYGTQLEAYRQFQVSTAVFNIFADQQSWKVNFCCEI